MQLQATEYTATYRDYTYDFTYHNGKWSVNRWPKGHVKIPPYAQALAEDLTWQGITLFTGRHAYFDSVEEAAKKIEDLS